MGVLEALQAALVTAAKTSDEATKASVDAKRAEWNKQLAGRLLPYQARTLIDDELAKRTTGANTEATQAKPSAMEQILPDPAKIDGGDGGSGRSILDIGGGQGAPVGQPTPTPIEQQRPGYVATTKTKPWYFGTTKSSTQYAKDEASINTHSAGIANAYEGVARGDPGSVKVLSDAIKSASAELGVFAGEAIAEGKSRAIRLRSAKVETEKATSSAVFDTIVEGGGTPAQAQMIAATANGTLAEKADAIRQSGFVSNSTQVASLTIRLRNQQLANERATARDNADIAHAKQMERQRKGLPGALGLRRTKEEVGQSLTEAQGAFRAIMKEGGEGGDIGAMFAQIQGNIAALSGDEWLKTTESWADDKIKAYKTKDIIINFAEADGRWVEEGLDREQALKKRRKAAVELEKIHGMPKHSETTVEGKLEFIWGEPTGPNAIRLNELLNAAQDLEDWELEKGKPLRDWTYSPKGLAIRKEKPLRQVTVAPGEQQAPSGRSRLGEVQPIPTGEELRKEGIAAKEELLGEARKARDSIKEFIEKKRREMLDKQRKFQESIGRFGE